VAENEIEIAAPPERVWEVLADASVYDTWVIGAQDVRDADETWPAVGSRLHHRTGVGPLTVDDETEVVESQPPTRLVLLARVGALGEFRVTLELSPMGSGGTSLQMVEDPVGGVAEHVPGTGAAIHARNGMSLQRLKTLAEESPVEPR
jgi:uncharacterized protein YndB with AHSA1/START domain